MELQLAKDMSEWRDRYLKAFALEAMKRVQEENGQRLTHDEAVDWAVNDFNAAAYDDEYLKEMPEDVASCSLSEYTE